MSALELPSGGLTGSVDHVLTARRSVRAYTSRPLSRELVAGVLDAASSAPSNSNTQPWRVHVLTGVPMKELGDALVKAFQERSLPPSTHFPDPLPPALSERQSDFAQRYYGALGIDRSDVEARARQTQRNFSFFGAPVGLIFSVDGSLGRHSWLDLGLFVQNVMIAAKARGIDTCPQVSFARFHSVIAPFLQMSPEQVTACGMAMGFGDPAASVNRMDMPRQRMEEFTRMVGFDEPVGAAAHG
ncbi:nitroreductase [Variovorax humicola]|uniref:Nitroreductase n=1 Tax=Variovorax humicola TaxID=1769758 RepID=A0ABU8W100_9BURK